MTTSSKEEPMAKGPLVNYIVVVILTVLLGVYLMFVLGDRFSPDETTLLYLYSSIFQGLAALLGILLVLMSFSYQRAYQSTRELRNEISKDFVILSGEETTDISLLKKRLTNWRRVAFVGFMKEVSTKRTRMESEKAQKGSPLWSEYTGGCQKLKRENDAYKRIYHALSQHEVENRFLRELPAATLMAMTPMVAAILCALPLLAMTKSPGIDGDIQSQSAVVMVYMTIVSVLFAFRYILKTFGVFLASSTDLDKSDVGIPSPLQSEPEYREAMKNADLNYMPVSADDPVDEFGRARQRDAHSCSEDK